MMFPFPIRIFRHHAAVPAMKERSKGRMAELLLEEIFAQLGERSSVKQMLGDLTALPVDDVVRELVGDIEDVIAKRREEAIAQLRDAGPEAPPPPPAQDVTPLPSPPARPSADKSGLRTCNDTSRRC